MNMVTHHFLIRAALVTALVLFCSCKKVELMGADTWEGTFHLPRGDQRAQLQLDFEGKDGMMSLPDLIPVPLQLTEMSRVQDSVFFTIGFRSGPTPCKALIAGESMAGIMESPRAGKVKFELSYKGPTESIFGRPKPAADAPVVINTRRETETEKAVQIRLQNLLTQYDLEPYLYTKNILIQDGVIPHSHPVLTINTDLDTDTYLLSTFLHEQMHWYTLSKEYDSEALGKEIMRRYPKVPVNLPEGAGSEKSTYLHILVCFLEYHTLEKVVGAEEAKAHIEFMTTQHYTWVFKTILEDYEELKTLFEGYGLLFE